MRPAKWPALLIIGAALTGCGSAGGTKPASSHQGLMVELPGSKGYFEIGAEGDPGGGRSSRAKKKVENRIVVHFYGTDGTTEMSPAPTDVTVEIGGENSRSTVPLLPATQGGFASAPGDFPYAFRGRLNAKIGGKPLEANFMIR
jgi:hypothetical protein